MFAKRGTDFGAKTPIKISKPTARSYTVRVIEVGYLDNSMWKANENAWETIPPQAYAYSALADQTKVIGYKSFFGSGASFVAKEHKDLWCCACGEINHQGEDTCYKCNAALYDLQNLDDNILETEGTYVTAAKMANSNNASEVQQAKEKFSKIKEYKDSANLMESCDTQIENLQGKKDKFKKILSITGWGFLALSAFPTFVFFVWNVWNSDEWWIPATCSCICALVLLAISFYILKSTHWTDKNAKRKKNTKISMIVAVVFFLFQPIIYFALYPFVSYQQGDYAVYINMYDVKEFEIPDGVTTIKQNAFFCCGSLESVKIPDSVTSIGSDAFYSCSNLTSVTIPDSVTSIGSGAFDWCGSLTSVVIPDSVRSIGSYAFYSCYNLTSVTIPDSVTSIGSGAFGYCDSLKSIAIPDSVTSIGSYAFNGCDSLEFIVIPNSVTNIDYRAFENCYCLSHVYYTGSQTEWEAIAIDWSNYSLTSAYIHYNYNPND